MTVSNVILRLARLCGPSIHAYALSVDLRRVADRIHPNDLARLRGMR